MRPPVTLVVAVAVFVVGFALGRVSAPSQNAPVSPTSVEAEPTPGVLSGVVAELQQVPNYTYLRLRTAAGESWAAVPSTTAVAPGQRVEVRESTTMTNFTSKALGRTFPRIVFGELADAAPQALPPSHPPVPPSPPDPRLARTVEATRQADAPLTLRVSDVFSERHSLQGRVVRVRGSVAKSTAVQGVHYAHVTDGSGTARAGDDDLVIISQTPIAPGSVVTAEGVVVLDKDIGIGAWPVVLEQVNLSP